VTAAPRPLNTGGVAVVDSTGAATVDLGPAGCDWVITSLSVATDSTSGTPTAKVYRNTVGPSGYIEGTTTGNGDTSNTRHVLADGDRLYTVWAGATVGARATVRVIGAQFPPGSATSAVQW
jgi:hypothetical protein